MKTALLIWGGYDFHEPEKIAYLFSGELKTHGFDTQTESSLECLNDVEKLKTYDLIFPCWTAGTLTEEQGKNLQTVIKSGTGLGGIHGGMGDAFRGNTEYEWMSGGHFLGHPYVGEYSVRIKDYTSPITRGLPKSFPYKSEQYYMMIDPGIHILADTEYTFEGRPCNMPVAWIKTWEKGRVFYSALGHCAQEFVDFPEAKKLTVQGLLWAAKVL